MTKIIYYFLYLLGFGFISTLLVLIVAGFIGGYLAYVPPLGFFIRICLYLIAMMGTWKVFAVTEG